MKMNNLELKNSIEALIFAWGDPVTITELVNYFKCEKSVIFDIIESLKEDYKNRGIRFNINGDIVSFSTNPLYGEIIKSFGMQVMKKNITEANMETLSVVAYLGPTTKSVVDNIRGVKSDGSIQNLLSRGLIKEIGRLKAPGKPFVYSVTDLFLKIFEIESLDELPPLLDREEIKERLQFTEISVEDMELILDNENINEDRKECIDEWVNKT